RCLQANYFNFRSAVVLALPLGISASVHFASIGTGPVWNPHVLSVIVFFLLGLCVLDSASRRWLAIVLIFGLLMLGLHVLGVTPGTKYGSYSAMWLYGALSPLVAVALGGQVRQAVQSRTRIGVLVAGSVPLMAVVALAIEGPLVRLNLPTFTTTSLSSF